MLPIGPGKIHLAFYLSWRDKYRLSIGSGKINLAFYLSRKITGYKVGQGIKLFALITEIKDLPVFCFVLSCPFFRK